MLSKLPEQDSNLRPAALKEWELEAFLSRERERASYSALDSQADGAKPDTEPATKSQSALEYCDRCGKLCFGDKDTAEEPILRDGLVICGECDEELTAGESLAGDE